ncbi:energy transducer TonB [Flavobacterium sp. 3-210]
MKKFLILVLICFVQNTFSQNTTQNAKNTETVITIDQPAGNSATTSNEDNAVYNTAGIDVKPDFPGGMEKFYQFVDSNFKTPEGAKNIKGKKIYITFVVEKDGSLTDIKVLRDAGYKTGAEAIRVLKICPKWNPGEHNGKKIRVLYSLPIAMK